MSSSSSLSSCAVPSLVNYSGSSQYPPSPGPPPTRPLPPLPQLVPGNGGVAKTVPRQLDERLARNRMKVDRLRS
ncbi:MAG: hypothetical protein M1815_001830 [Lichina confinis]|nr:MAG: hypothetical protein M1815_001830 [Lichina confinis]